jgi:hypothetical protein
MEREAPGDGPARIGASIQSSPVTARAIVDDRVVGLILRATLEYPITLVFG